MQRRTWLGIGLALTLVGGGAWLKWGLARPTKPTYQTSAVDRGAIAAKVSATGTLSALVTVQVGSQVSGRLQLLRADFNSQVHKGEVLAKLDPQLFEAALEREEANTSAARSSLQKAEVEALTAQRQAERSAFLAKRRLIAQADLETAQTTADSAKAQVAVARANLEQAHAALQQAQVNLAYTTVVSPVDGIVISRNVDVGQTVAASLQAPTLFVIAQNLRKMQVDTSISEADIGRLRPGMPAVFSVDAYPNETFRASIRQIRNAPQTVQNIVTYDAVLDVDNPDLQLRPGMTANVTVTYDSREDALRVPNAALRVQMTMNGAQGHGGAGPQGNRPGQGMGGPHAWQVQGHARGKAVWVDRDGQPARVMIKTGLSDGTYTEVLGDRLHAGDPVITDMEAAPARGKPGGRGPRGFM